MRVRKRNVGIALVIILVLTMNVSVFAATLGETLSTAETGWMRIDDTNDKIQYSGQWQSLSRNEEYNGSDHRTLAVSGDNLNSLTFRFEGTGIRLIGKLIPVFQTEFSSSAQVVIDGVTYNTVDLFSTNNDAVPMALTFEKSGLYEGIHEITIVDVNKKILIIDAFDILEGDIVDISTPLNPPTTLDVVSEKNEVSLGEEFVVNLRLNNANEILAEDSFVSYDKTLFEYVGYEKADGITVYKEVSDGIERLRFMTASDGKENVINSDHKTLIKIKFKAIEKGEGLIDVTAGRIANISTEWDLEPTNCGETKVKVVGPEDVDYTGEYTLVDLAIDAYYLEDDIALVDDSKHNADQIIDADNEINGLDLAKVVDEIFGNIGYLPNTY